MSDSIALDQSCEDPNPPSFLETLQLREPSFPATTTLARDNERPPRQDPPTPGRIPSGVTFEGSITGTSAYEVHGILDGGISLEGADLLIKEGATVSGTVSARNAVIAGKVSGEITCPKGCVTFSSTARCDATLAYGELVVERGAKVNAQLRSTGE